VTDKADVYAFGLVLWEIITGQEPFLQFDDYGTFKKAITKEHERPVIPKDTVCKHSIISLHLLTLLALQHPSLKALMEKCWHPNPSNRPSFTEILPILDAVLVECLVDDSVACKFWKDNFLGKVLLSVMSP
jgi:serine/threonine protein kinase